MRSRAATKGKIAGILQSRGEREEALRIIRTNSFRSMSCWAMCARGHHGKIARIRGWGPPRIQPRNGSPSSSEACGWDEAPRYFVRDRDRQPGPPAAAGFTRAGANTNPKVAMEALRLRRLIQR